MDHLKWKIKSRELVYDAKIAKLYKQHSQREQPEDQREFTFFTLDCPDWCNIIAVTENAKVVLIRQYRPGIDGVTLEMPGGGVESGEANVGNTALRELTEETGYELVPGGKFLELGWTYPNPAIQNNRCHLFACGPVRQTRAQSLDPAEVIDIELVDVEKIPDLIESGKIDHALMLNAFLFLMVKRNSLPGSTNLTETLKRLSAL